MSPKLDFGHWGVKGGVAECVCEAPDKFKTVASKVFDN